MNGKAMRNAAGLLLCAAMLTACGADPAASSVAEQVVPATTTAAETTETAETTADTAKTTADTTKAAAVTTTAAETTAAAEDTTKPAAETTAAPAETEASAESEEQPAQEPEPVQTEAPAVQSIWDALKIGGGVADYLAANPGYRQSNAPSCLGSGEDITYTYTDRVLMTYSADGSEVLNEIDITAAGIPTRKGIEVGASAADVERAYGAPTVGAYYYKTEDGTLEFYIEGETVTSIALY